MVDTETKAGETWLAEGTNAFEQWGKQLMADQVYDEEAAKSES